MLIRQQLRCLEMLKGTTYQFVKHEMCLTPDSMHLTCEVVLSSFPWDKKQVVVYQIWHLKWWVSKWTSDFLHMSCYGNNIMIGIVGFELKFRKWCFCLVNNSYGSSNLLWRYRTTCSNRKVINWLVKHWELLYKMVQFNLYLLKSMFFRRQRIQVSLSDTDMLYQIQQLSKVQTRRHIYWHI